MYGLTTFQSESLMRRDQLEDLSLGGRTILKRKSKKSKAIPVTGL
jgi:hypothetical protein